MKKRFGRPSPALIISVIALFVALGGASYAAVKIGKNAVKTKNIADKAVTKKKLAPSVRGRAVAYAEVRSDGSVGPNSRGISNSNISVQGSGNTTSYCLHGLPDFGTVTVTPGWAATEFDGIVSANIEQSPFVEGLCSAVSGAKVGVLTYYDDFFGAIAPVRSPKPFTIVLFK